MKKVLFTAAFAVAGLVSVSAQTSGVEGTVHVGIPVGDASDFSSFNLGVDLAYLHPITSNFKLGAKVGYDHFIAKSDYKDFGGKDFGFIPLAATAKLEFNNNLFIGADLGYAFAATDNIDGGLFWQPKFGYSGASFDVYAAYKGISVDNDLPNVRNFNADAVSLGFAYKF